MKMNTFLKVDYIEPVRYAGSSMQGSSALKGINVWINGEGYFFECNRYTVCDPREVREDAYQQAFGLFKELYDMTPRDRADVFGKVIITCANFECKYHRNGYCGIFRPSCRFAGT